jgi:hypothetical protein
MQRSHEVFDDALRAYYDPADESSIETDTDNTDLEALQAAPLPRTSSWIEQPQSLQQSAEQTSQKRSAGQGSMTEGGPSSAGPYQADTPSRRRRPGVGGMATQLPMFPRVDELRGPAAAAMGSGNIAAVGLHCNDGDGASVAIVPAWRLATMVGGHDDESDDDWL